MISSTEAARTESEGGRALADELGIMTATALAAAAALAAVAVVLVARRIGGSFVQPLGGGAFFTAAAVTGTVAAVVRWTWWRGGRCDAAWALGQREPFQLLAFALPGAAAIVLLGAITIAGTPGSAVMLAWFGLVAAEAGAWSVVARQMRGWDIHRATGRETRPTATGRGTRPAVRELEDLELPSGLVQQLSRVRENGSESVHAVLRADVREGERLAIAHVAFCPPLDGPPQLAAHALDGDDAEVRIAQAETFGARLEIRLPAAAPAPRSVVVELVGTAEVP